MGFFFTFFRFSFRVCWVDRFFLNFTQQQFRKSFRLLKMGRTSIIFLQVSKSGRSCAVGFFMLQGRLLTKTVMLFLLLLWSILGMFFFRAVVFFFCFEGDSTFSGVFFLKSFICVFRFCAFLVGGTLFLSFLRLEGCFVR